MLFNFRFDRSETKEIIRRITEDHLLCQGWDGGEDGGLDIQSEDFIIKCRDYYDLASIRCSRQRTDTSPFESGETTLLVQVKKHSGKTDEWAIKQLVATMEKEPTADGCVMSLADGFTVEAEAVAQQHGIMLMEGKTICRLLLGRLTSTGSTSAA